MITQEMITSDTQNEFGGSEHANEKILLANQAMSIGVEWMQNQAKCEDPNMSRGDKRRLRRSQKAALRQHIEESLKQSSNPKAVGFIIPAIILSLIFESVISWVVWHILEKYFG